jgi:His-Xaa-Ser system radical SAM maturase HxsC
MRLTTAGLPLHFSTAVVGKVVTRAVPRDDRSDKILIGLLHDRSADESRGFRGIITPSRAQDNAQIIDGLALPIVHSVREIDHLRDGDIVVMQPKSGFVRTLHRPDSVHNVLFMTERCNSNCLMCSQPPKDKDDTEQLTEINLELLRLMPPTVTHLTITGGEPTLLRNRLFRILRALRETLPNTDVHMLTNGRLFAWPAFTQGFVEAVHPRLVLGIPLYSDSSTSHDYIVQAKHAFDQTVMGLHQLARHYVPVEIRVVLHRLTIPRLPQLAEYVYRNFPFVVHVALMGLEPTGYTPRNKDILWIDPVEYQDKLEQSVEILATRGMNVSIYNSQLCLLRPSLWKFARKSISDWKNIYLQECQECKVLEQCGGLFQSAEKMHSPYIRAFRDHNSA